MTVTCPDCKTKMTWTLQPVAVIAICVRCYGPSKGKKGYMRVSANPRKV